MLPLHQSDIHRKKQSRFAYATRWPHNYRQPTPIRSMSLPKRVSRTYAPDILLAARSRLLLSARYFDSDCPFTVTGLLLITPLWAFPIQSTALDISFHQRGLSRKAISRFCLQNGKRQRIARIPQALPFRRAPGIDPEVGSAMRSYVELAVGFEPT